MIYGYARVSTKEQNEQRQLIALREYGVEDKRIFVDKQSGKDFERQSYKRLMRKIKKDEISLPKWIQSYKSETTLKSLEIRHFTAFATSSAALGEGRFSVLCS